MNTALKTAIEDFAEIAAPYLNIADEVHYEDTLTLVEELLEEADDSADDPVNGIIEILAQAIAKYESKNDDIAAFEAQAREAPADVVMLRVLMSQHNLGVADLPEIGDKSLVSRILSGTRNLTKRHIQKLARRFNIDPGMFFDR